MVSAWPRKGTSQADVRPPTKPIAQLAVIITRAAKARLRRALPPPVGNEKLASPSAAELVTTCLAQYECRTLLPGIGSIRLTTASSSAEGHRAIVGQPELARQRGAARLQIAHSNYMPDFAELRPRRREESTEEWTPAPPGVPQLGGSGCSWLFQPD